MPELLLELLSEELPARMQRRAADDLKRLVTAALVDAGLAHDGAAAFVTPRRLALTVAGLPVRSAPIREERKGPRVGAPQVAIEGFVRAAGLDDISEAQIVRDPKKGDRYLAVRETPGQPTLDILARILEDTIRTFPWPKSMRWGNGNLRWARPLHGIVATFGADGEEPDIVPLNVDGLTAGNMTRGHRFMAPEIFAVRRYDDYVTRLERARVMLDTERRKASILADARDRALALGLELVADETLLEEVAGLVEWPVVLGGRIDPAFLSLPDAVIRLTIRNNQKCFVLRDPKTGSLSDRFIVTANIEARDDGAAIVAGNERVVHARLADARFFYETDLKVPLEEWLPKLNRAVFHERLGTQGARVRRLETLAQALAPEVGADAHAAARAARLAKADLVTGMVGEFPELQGHMGHLYATAQGEPADVAAAIEEHYRPQGPEDVLPVGPVATAVALADKLDTLVGFFGIGETPTGSKDPYALRRAALGIVRIVLGNELRVDLRHIVDVARNVYKEENSDVLEAHATIAEACRPSEEQPFEATARHVRNTGMLSDLIAFFIDRLTVQLRAQGLRHDLVAAVVKAEQSREDWRVDLVDMVARSQAVSNFLASEDGANLLAGYRRAANILRAEEKKDGASIDGAPDRALCRELAETELFDVVERASVDAASAAERADYAAAMATLATLRGPVDRFFDAVLVNAPEPELRRNRLRLLSRIRVATLPVADFASVEG